MRMQRITEGHEPGVEPHVAIPATPRIETKNTQKVVNCELTTRTSRIFTFAYGAGHLGALELLNSENRIGESALVSKYNKVLFAPVEWSWWNTILS